MYYNLSGQIYETGGVSPEREIQPTIIEPPLISPGSFFSPSKVNIMINPQQPQLPLPPNINIPIKPEEPENKTDAKIILSVALVAIGVLFLLSRSNGRKK